MRLLIRRLHPRRLQPNPRKLPIDRFLVVSVVYVVGVELEVAVFKLRFAFLLEDSFANWDDAETHHGDWVVEERFLVGWFADSSDDEAGIYAHGGGLIDYKRALEVRKHTLVQLTFRAQQHQ